MPVNINPPDPKKLFPVPGVELGVTEAGIRKANRKDLLIMRLAANSTVAGVFTQNRFCAAPVTLCRDHLMTNDGVRALVVNTGCANAGTGEDGLKRAHETCLEAARTLGFQPSQVLPFSTGVILEPLPIERVKAGLPAAVADSSCARTGMANRNPLRIASNDSTKRSPNACVATVKAAMFDTRMAVSANASLAMAIERRTVSPSTPMT